MLKRKIEDTLLQWKNTRADILQGNLGGFKGAIFENLMADTLHKKEQNLYYFQKDSGLEPEELVLESIDTNALNSLAKKILGKDKRT